MRNDATIDGRKVICPNATLLGFATLTARVGSFLIYRDSSGACHYARMIGRVAYAPALAGDAGPVKNFILGMVLSSSMQGAFERWIDPLSVIEVHDTPPAALLAFFAGPLPCDAQTLRRVMEHGTVQDQFIDQVPARIAQFKKGRA